MVVNAILRSAKLDVPRVGAQCEITAEDLALNLDNKPAEKSGKPVVRRFTER